MSRALLFAVGLPSLVLACSDHDEHQASLPPPEQPALSGTLEYSWSINGRQDAQDCAATGAVSFESVIVDHGYVIDAVTAACTDFSVSVPLYVSDFLTRSALTDGNGFPALHRIVEDTFLIDDGKVTRLVIDFPSPAVPVGAGADAGVPVAEDTPPAEDVPPPAELADAGVDSGLP